MPRWYAWPLLLLLASCKTGMIDPGTDVHAMELDRGALPDAADAGVNDAFNNSIDLTTKANDPCTYGKCIDTLICMANICHAICSTECGDTAPECETTEGCHWVTSFSAACLPGEAAWPETCGGGVSCIGGNLCVNLSGKGTMCLKLCKYGCPSGTQCGSTNNGCKVCIP